MSTRHLLLAARLHRTSGIITYPSTAVERRKHCILRQKNWTSACLVRDRFTVSGSLIHSGLYRLLTAKKVDLQLSSSGLNLARCLHANRSSRVVSAYVTLLSFLHICTNNLGRRREDPPYRLNSQTSKLLLQLKNSRMCQWTPPRTSNKSELSTRSNPICSTCERMVPEAPSSSTTRAEHTGFPTTA